MRPLWLDWMPRALASTLVTIVVATISGVAVSIGLSDAGVSSGIVSDTGIAVSVAVCVPVFFFMLRLVGVELGAGTETPTHVMTAIAVFLAGRRHAHLREAWGADLHGDPEAREPLPSGRRLRLASGFVIAALRCRADDAVLLAWRPVDALLASWRASRIAVLAPVTGATWAVLIREGFYGLVNHWNALAGIATATYFAIKGLRRYRRIETPKRPEKKTSLAGGS
jgi:hypothetical protein